MKVYMEKLISEILIVIGLIAGTGWGIKSVHDFVRAEAIAALKNPTPSLADFTNKLLKPR